MMSDPLADRVRNAVDAFELPPVPAARVAARIATSRAAVAPKRHPALAIAGGVAVLSAALAVAVVPTASKWMTPAYLATMKRLTGMDWSRVQSYDVAPMSLDEARRHTRFPIVVPRGFRVVNATALPNDVGVSLVLDLPSRDQAVLNEHWADAKRSKLPMPEGVGVRSDGSIKHFSVRHWRIGRVAFSMPVFDRDSRRYAEAVERATREAAAGTP